MMNRFIIGGLSLFPYLISAQTLITGVIEGNQNWTAAGSPYQVTNGSLKHGSKLVLEAGATLEFKNEFVCSGELISKGTAQQNVVITGNISFKSKKKIQFAYTELQNFRLETDADIDLNHVSAEESIIIGYNLLVKDSEFQGGKLESRAWVNQFLMENCKLDGCEITASGKGLWKNNEFDGCKIETGSESFRITGNTFKRATVGLLLHGNSKGSNTLTFNTFEDNKTHIEMRVSEGYEQNMRVENNVFGKATHAIKIQSFNRTTRDGWHLGDKIPVSWKNNYWDNRSATELQAAIIDAEDDIKLTVVLGTEPQLTEKPVMNVADNAIITSSSMPKAVKHLTKNQYNLPHIPKWVIKVVGILLLSFLIQYLVKKI
jgi:Right handed beta helix region